MPEPEQEEKLSPPATDEEAQELYQQAKDARMLESMIEQPGWHQILAPRLRNMRNNFMMAMLSSSEFPALLKNQQVVNTLDLVFGLVETGITAGRSAAARLRLLDEQRAGKTGDFDAENQDGG